MVTTSNQGLTSQSKCTGEEKGREEEKSAAYELADVMMGLLACAHWKGNIVVPS